MKSLAHHHRFILLTRLQEAKHTKNFRYLGLVEVDRFKGHLGVQHVEDFERQQGRLNLTKTIVKAQEKAIIECGLPDLLIGLIID